nr:MAG TPA: hypothetical protein [Caudoviricetes sp.]
MGCSFFYILFSDIWQKSRTRPQKRKVPLKRNDPLSKRIKRRSEAFF